MIAKRSRCWPCRAALVDDEQLARDELGFLLGQIGGVEVIGQAGNGVEALRPSTGFSPDVVFLDVQMPGLTGSKWRAGCSTRQRRRTSFSSPRTIARDRGVRGQRRRLPAEAGRRRRGSSWRCQAGAPAGRVERSPDGGHRSRQSHASSREIVHSSPSARTGASGWRSKSASAFCSCRPKRSSLPRWPTTTITVVTSQHVGTSNYRTLDELQARLDPECFLARPPVASG